MLCNRLVPKTDMFAKEALNAAEADLAINLVGVGRRLLREPVTQPELNTFLVQFEIIW